MKWLGQHIWDLISRFRSDVYLESIDSGTVVTGGVLGLDSKNKVVKTSKLEPNRKLNYALYRWQHHNEGGAISTINLPADTALPTVDAVIDAENSYIVTQIPISGNAGATVEIGINSGGGASFLGTDTDFFMAPTAYNAAPFNGYGGVAKGLAKVGRIVSTTQITFKIATATLTAGHVEVHVAYKTVN